MSYFGIQMTHMANDNKQSASHVRKTIRLPRELFEDLEAIGSVDKRSFNNLVTDIVLTEYRNRKKIDPKYAAAIKNRKSS